MLNKAACEKDILSYRRTLLTNFSTRSTPSASSRCSLRSARKTNEAPVAAALHSTAAAGSSLHAHVRLLRGCSSALQAAQWAAHARAPAA